MGPLSGRCEINITSITCILQDNLDFKKKSLAFNMFFTLMLVEVKLKWKMEFLNRAKSATKHHTNPYIESTTVLSDIFYNLKTTRDMPTRFDLRLAAFIY